MMIVMKDIFYKLMFNDLQNIEKLIANVHDGKEHVIHIENLKQALIRGLVFKKFI